MVGTPPIKMVMNGGLLMASLYQHSIGWRIWCKKHSFRVSLLHWVKVMNIVTWCQGSSRLPNCPLDVKGGQQQHGNMLMSQNRCSKQEMAEALQGEVGPEAAAFLAWFQKSLRLNMHPDLIAVVAFSSFETPTSSGRRVCSLTAKRNCPGLQFDCKA